MVNKSLFGTILLSALAMAAPMPGDSSLGKEVAVSAPNGIPLSDTAELASQTAKEGCCGGDMTTTAKMMEETTMMMEPPMKSEKTSMKEPPMKEPPMTTTMETSMAEETSMAKETTMAEETMTTSSVMVEATSSVMYGSGSNMYGSGYDGCVQQCMAQFGAPSAAYTASPTMETAQSNEGNGVTHTVIVAPSKGVLRYVPFAVNASVGDTVRFEWHADNHFVSKSSVLEPCNKTSDAFFTSGIQNQSFVFNQVVNDTNPTFFYCATPNHCQAGMFGIINPPSSAVAPTNIGQMMTALAANDNDLSTAWAYTNSKTANTSAFAWGNNIDMAQLPDWSHKLIAQNVLYSRQTFAANPSTMNDDGTMNIGAASGQLMVPPDLQSALSSTGGYGAPAGSSPAASTDAGAQTAGAANAAASAPASNGARSLGASGAVAGAVAVFMTFLAL